ncbi:MAG: TAXI family TRAP transporter solute-binding subunit [Melioribacteraceae bacterium]|nr:TAXI family TRAP transporter solute-binding subunit [Melioribacteraceae bacterium]
MKSIVLTLVAIAFIIPIDIFSQMYRFSGGPSGGTYQYYASAISTLAKKNKIRVLASSSGGSIENIRTCNSGKSSFGIAFSSQIYAALNGTLPKDTNKYENVRALGFFFGAVGQLVVRKNSGINTLNDLVGKKIGIGNAGSGTAANCEAMLKYLNLWDKIDAENLGFRSAANAFKNGQLDAFWIFSGPYNASILEVALQEDIKLLSIWDELEKAGYFAANPYFLKAIIPAGTYKGQDNDIVSFQDGAIWIASKKVSEDIVYNLLKIVYSEKGLAHMVSIHKSAREMSIEGGLTGIVTPLHDGATKFWKEMGVIK